MIQSYISWKERNILKTKYKKLAQSKQAAIVLCSLLKESMCSSVNDSLPQHVVDSMKGSSAAFNTKKSLKVKVLTNLAEKEDLDLFFEYFKDAKASIQYWIRRYIQEHCDSTDVDQQVSWINKEISCLFQQSKDHIIDVVKRISPSLSLFRQFFKIARTRERFRIGILFIPLRVLVREIQLSVETKSKR